MGYNCVQQYMLYHKACRFGDYDIADEIITENDPRIQKELGTSVKRFNKSVWAGQSANLFFRANFLKFTQNENLYNIFMSTEGSFVEASPNNTLWGIGLDIDDPDCEEKSKWRGRNLSGDILTSLREDLIIQSTNFGYDYLCGTFSDHIKPISSKPQDSYNAESEAAFQRYLKRNTVMNKGIREIRI